jgi:hypothetical protein
LRVLCDRCRRFFTCSRTCDRGARERDLRDAGEYIAALPKKVHDAPEWRDAMEALLLVVERGGPTMLARIGVMRALKPTLRPRVQSERKRAALGAAQAEEGSMPPART